MTENASEETPTVVSSVVVDGTVINDEVDNIQDVNDDDNTINAACEFDRDRQRQRHRRQCLCQTSKVINSNMPVLTKDNFHICANGA